jgi:hypothetical protein
VDIGQVECEAAILDGTRGKRIDHEEDNGASAKEKKNPSTLSSERWHPVTQSRPFICTGCGLGAQTGSRFRIDGIPTATIPVEDNFIDIASALYRDEPVCNVACDRLRLALCRRTEAPAARQAQNH